VAAPGPLWLCHCLLYSGSPTCRGWPCPSPRGPHVLFLALVGSMEGVWEGCLLASGGIGSMRGLWSQCDRTLLQPSFLRCLCRCSEHTMVLQQLSQWLGHRPMCLCIRGRGRRHGRLPSSGAGGFVLSPIYFSLCALASNITFMLLMCKSTF
jgi:hypothetical protein